MANEKISARIIGQGGGDTPELTNIIINWRLSAPVGGASAGENIFPIEIPTMTDTEIEANLREQLSAFVTDLAAVPGVVFTAADVLGCKF